MTSRTPAKMLFMHWTWVTPMFLLGCAVMAPLKAPKLVDVAIYPKVNPYTQAIVPNYTIANIATLSIIPHIETAPGVYSSISSVTGNPVAADAQDVLRLSMASPSIDPNRPFIIRHLKANSNYRILARAYASNNGAISNDASSLVELALTNNDAPTLATVPVNLVNVPFAATTSVTLNVEGKFDYLKTTLYLMAGNAQIGVSTTTQTKPEVTFGNLQANTNYRVVAEAYKLGAVKASQSLDITTGNDNAPATQSIALNVPYFISTVAGNGNGTYDGDGGQATAAGVNRPYCVASDPHGNLYIAEPHNNRIRKVSRSGVISTFAGYGSATHSGDGGAASSAGMNYCSDVICDFQGNVYIADTNNHRIRKVDANGIMSTVTGNGTAAFTGDGGQASSASINTPVGVTIDAQGILYIADWGNNRIRKIDKTGVITTVAGNGTAGSAGDGGLAINASLNSPRIPVFDSKGNLYIPEWAGQRIRKVNTSGIISTIAGNGTAGFTGDGGLALNATLNNPDGAICDLQDNLFIADRTNHRIRKIDKNGIITTVAGNGTAGSSGDGGLATNGNVNMPRGLNLDSQGNILISDNMNHKIRVLR